MLIQYQSYWLYFSTSSTASYSRRGTT